MTPVPGQLLSTVLIFSLAVAADASAVSEAVGWSGLGVVGGGAQLY